MANFRACSRDRGILSSRERAGDPWHIHHDLLVDQGELPDLIMAPPPVRPLPSCRGRELIFSARLQDNACWECAFCSQTCECDE